MRTLTLAMLLALMLPAQVLAREISVTPENLLPFAGQLISQTEKEEEPKPEPRTIELPVPDATTLWKWIGYGTMAVCGIGVPASVEYRRSESDWEPVIPATPVNVSAWFATSVAANSLSDWQRRSERSDLVAASIRLGTLAGCAFAAGQNLYNGYERQ